MNSIGLIQWPQKIREKSAKQSQRILNHVDHLDGFRHPEINLLTSDVRLYVQKVLSFPPVYQALTGQL